MDWSKVDEALRAASYPYEIGEKSSEEIREEYTKGGFVFPGAVLLVGRGGDVLYHKASRHCRQIWFLM